MKHRSVVAVLLLPFVTFGIYTLYWLVKSKLEMSEVGAKIPSAWLIIIPIVNIYWLWKFSEGVETVTKGAISAAVAFILQFLLGFIGNAIIQSYLNKVAGGQPAAAPAEPSQPSAPAPSGQ